MKHTGDICDERVLSSDVDAIKRTDLGIPKINGDSWCYVANLDNSVCTLSLGDLSRFRICAWIQFAHTHWAIFQDLEFVHGFSLHTLTGRSFKI